MADIFNIQPNVKDRHYDSASYDVTGYANIGHFVTQADIAAGYTIVDRMEAITAPILSEEAGFSLVAGREVISNPTQLLNLWYAGLWDGTDLLEMINNKAFGMIVLRAQFYPTPVLEAIGANYEIEDSIPMNGFNYLLLIPR